MPYHKQTPKMKKKNENLPKTEIENLIPFYFLSFSCNPNAHKHRRSTKDRLCVFGIVKIENPEVPISCQCPHHCPKPSASY